MKRLAPRDHWCAFSIYLRHPHAILTPYVAPPVAVHGNGIDSAASASYGCCVSQCFCSVQVEAAFSAEGREGTIVRSSQSVCASMAPVRLLQPHPMHPKSLVSLRI